MLGSITVMSDHSNKQWRKKVDKLTTVFGTLLNHLSKVFDLILNSFWWIFVSLGLNGFL